MIRANELRKWLVSLAGSDFVYVDEGGLTLRSLDDPDAYLEIGGDPDLEDDDS